MGVMSRQREANIVNGLVADAGDIDAELDHIVSEHNLSEVRLVAAEADIDTNETDIAANAADIDDIQSQLTLTQEIVAAGGSTNYVQADRDTVTLYLGTSNINLSIADPNLTDNFVGEIREIHNISSSYYVRCSVKTPGPGSVGNYYKLEQGDVLRMKFIDFNGAGDYRWSCTVLKAVEAEREEYIDSGSLGTIIITADDLARAYFLNEDGGTLALQLPTITEALVGRRVLVANTGITPFNVQGDGTQVCMEVNQWGTGGFSGFSLAGGGCVELVVAPQQAWEYSGGTLTTRYGWVAIAGAQ